MAHQSTSVTCFIFLIYILVPLVQRCCSSSPLGLSSAVAAMLFFSPLLNRVLNDKHLWGFFFPVLRLLSNNKLLVFLHPCHENKTTKLLWVY